MLLKIISNNLIRNNAYRYWPFPKDTPRVKLKKAEKVKVKPIIYIKILLTLCKIFDFSTLFEFIVSLVITKYNRFPNINWIEDNEIRAIPL